MMTTQRKLEEVERLIERYRWARSDGKAPENASYWALKAVAADLRARLPETPGPILGRIQGAIDAASREKVGNRYSDGHVRAVAEAVIGSWPTIRQALEDFEIDDGDYRGG